MRTLPLLNNSPPIAGKMANSNGKLCQMLVSWSISEVLREARGEKRSSVDERTEKGRGSEDDSVW